MVAGDTVTSLSQAFDSRNAGSRTLTVTGFTVNDGNGGANYVVASNSATGTITPAPLTLNASTDSKVYDSTVGSLATPGVAGLIAGDTVTSPTQAFDSRNAGSRTLTVTGFTVNDGNGGANYVVASNAATGTITPAALTLAASPTPRSTTATRFPPRRPASSRVSSAATP